MEESFQWERTLFHVSGIFFIGEESVNGRGFVSLAQNLFHGDGFCFMGVKSTEYQRHGA